MSNNKRHNALLKKLLEGDISEPEKWELERASLDDAFLSDAIEGYYDNKEENDARFIDNFNGKIVNTKNLKTRYKYLSVAASLLILISVYWSYTQFQTIENLDMVSEVEKVSIPESSTDNVVDEKESDMVNKSAQEKPLAQKDKQHIKQDPSTKKVSRGIKNKTAASSRAVNNSNLDEVAAAPSAPQMEESASLVIEKVESVKPLPMVSISGVVRNNFDEPIAAAEINSRRGVGPVFTDSAGNFTIVLNEGDDTLFAEANGFTKQKLKAESNLDIRLQATKNKLSEEPKLLAELLEPYQLVRLYADKLDKYFRNNPVLLCNAELSKLKRIKIVVSVLQSNRIDRITLSDNVDESCRVAIESAFYELSNDGFFEGKQQVKFDYFLTFL